MVKLLRDCWLNCTQCCRKTCLTSAKGARQRLAARAHRAVVTDPSSNSITPNFPCTSARPLANRIWVRSAVGTERTGIRPWRCPLIGAKQTSSLNADTSESDLYRTLVQRTDVDYPALPTRLSISLRSATKSMGLVS